MGYLIKHIDQIVLESSGFVSFVKNMKQSTSKNIRKN